MTSPNQPPPSGAIVIGENWHQEQKTQQQVINEMTGDTRNELSNAAGRYTNDMIQLTDGQSGLEDRTDLLDGARGYLHLIQSKNWVCPLNTSARKLPFDRQVGPPKGASMSNGGIRLMEKGLWRADTIVCWDKALGTIAQPNITYTGTVLAVHNSSNNSLFTRKHYYTTIDGTIDPHTVMLSHEFVIPEDNVFDVSVWVAFNRANGVFGNPGHKMLGGIQYTGLWVTKIDSRIENQQPGVNDSVPDGGGL